MAMVRLSGLWKTEGKDGKTYLRGSMNPAAAVFIMKNDYKSSDKDPDFFLYVSQKQKKGDQSGKAQDNGGNAGGEDLPW